MFGGEKNETITRLVVEVRARVMVMGPTIQMLILLNKWYGLEILILLGRGSIVITSCNEEPIWKCMFLPRITWVI